MFFLLTIWISDVVSKFPSRRGFMADRFVCVSAFVPHTFRGNEAVQMFWKEERQPGGGGPATPLTRATSHRFLLPRLLSLSRRASKITSLPLSLSVLIMTPSSWA